MLSEEDEKGEGLKVDGPTQEALAIRGGEDDERSWFLTIADNSLGLLQRDNKRAG